jgi:adenosylmethionine---8-amino-7-oxononanoate aminotransferase
MALSLPERDKKVIWHPYMPQKYVRGPIPIVKGCAAWIEDDKGNRYLDAISSWWVNIHGHAHPYIAERIYKQALQLEQVIFAGFTHEPAIRLAEKLLAILPPGFSKIFYSDDGSTATEVALKMATQYWWNKGDRSRTRILAFKNSYHGDTFGAMSVSERSIFTAAFNDRLFEVIHVEVPTSGEHVLINDLSAADTKKLLGQCACVIYEPLVQGAGGMNMYEPGALNGFLAECKKHDVICIADEVMTGFGRTGKMFASEYCSVHPDIICLSKGITGGTMALGATACTSEIHEAFVVDDKSKTFFHGHSFTANPIACTAALASLELFELENTLDRIKRIEEKHAGFLKSLADCSKVENLRQRGTIIAFEVKAQKPGYLSEVREIITEEGLKRGVYLRPLGNTVYVMPPYCITSEELDIVYDCIRGIVREL